MTEDSKQQCRVCLEYVQNYKDFSSILENGSTSDTIYSCMEFCIKRDLSVFPLPMVLCIPCTKGLRFSYDFLRSALESDSKFRQALLQPQEDIEVENEIFTSTVYIKNEPLEPITPSDQLIETQNDTPAFTVVSLHQNVEIKEEQESMDEDSESCSSEEPSTESSNSKVPFRDRKISSAQNLHENPVEEAALQCAKCGKQLQSKRMFNKHLLNAHKTDQIFTCNICRNEFAKSRNLVKHLRIHGKRFQCNICAKEFYLNSRLVVHMRTHTNEMPFKCKLCFKTFTSEWYLTRHSKLHSTHKCAYCDNEFKNFNSMRYHEMTEHLKCPYHCPHCDKGFLKRNQFKEHFERIHGDEMTEEELDAMRIENLKLSRSRKIELTESMRKVQDTSGSLKEPICVNEPFVKMEPN